MNLPDINVPALRKIIERLEQTPSKDAINLMALLRHDMDLDKLVWWNKQEGLKGAFGLTEYEAVDIFWIDDGMTPHDQITAIKQVLYNRGISI